MRSRSDVTRTATLATLRSLSSPRILIAWMHSPILFLHLGARKPSGLKAPAPPESEARIYCIAFSAGTPLAILRASVERETLHLGSVDQERSDLDSPKASSLFVTFFDCLRYSASR